VPTDLAHLTAADFESRLENIFVVATLTGEIALKLVEVCRLDAEVRSGGAFSLRFVGPPGPYLAQQIHPLVHPSLGTLAIFLVPLGPLDGGNSYEAVFS
jgi:hypothetical protein